MTHRIGERPLQEPLLGRALQWRAPIEMAAQILEHRVESRDFSGKVGEWFAPRNAFCVR